MLSPEVWTQVRRLHAEGLSIKQIARVEQLAPNTVRRLVRSPQPPRYRRPPRPSLAEPFAERILALLQVEPSLTAVEIARRTRWPASMSLLRAHVARLRPRVPVPAVLQEARVPEAVVEPVSLEPGWVDCGLWWPQGELEVGAGQTRRCPVLVMVAGHSRHVAARLLPTARFSDVWIAHHQVLQQWGVLPHTLHWNLAGIQDPWPLAGWSTYIAQAELNEATVTAHSTSRLDSARRHLNKAFRPEPAGVRADEFAAALHAWADGANSSEGRQEKADLLWAYERRAMARNPRSPQALDPATILRRRDTPDDRGQLTISGNTYQVGPWGTHRRLTIDLTDTTVTIRSSGYHAGGFHVLTYSRSWAQNILLREPLHHVVVDHLSGVHREVEGP